MLNESVKLQVSKKAKIHSTTIFLGGEVVIEDDVEIGPYCVVNGNIILKKGVRLTTHIAISGNTIIGEGTVIHSFASVGSVPQDVKYKGEKSYTEIGKNNIIRENVTINSGTAQGGFYTRIGHNNLFMIACHIGHDCQIGNNCIIANNVGIAGHVIIQDNVIVGGNSGVHQFVRIGKNSMIGGMSGVGLDIPPFSLYTGSRENKLRGLNLVGLKRHGCSNQEIKNIKSAYEFVFSNSNIIENAKSLLEKTKDEKVKTLLQFILDGGSRGVCNWDGGAKEQADV
jgi:UDP-N-acetylglucosamine acyltransferase